jgi:hypothetical protein
MKHKSSVVFWMSMAFGVALGLAASVLAVHGVNEKSLVRALQVTARWSFLLFWMAYSVTAITALLGPALEPIARRGREFGLAYAAAQSIHLGLVAWLFQMTSRLPLTGRPFVFFTIGIVWTYLLALFSVGVLSKTLGSGGWRALRVLGLNYILFAFAMDFVPAAIEATRHYEPMRIIAYVPFATMAVLAPVLVLAAAAYCRLGTRYEHPELEPVVS